ncbi:MAG: tRNA (adenosine(37)-N6)-threonylcarbamoyltransferase complex dimerization subunit type 1 TsaB [Spirochaetes bacterium]|nr:tRNA (adenosine(37)-N6)-threonylcarbamoyltransferase complex dimerization subunit type 1 TsaB [Spirochaetota bacterium]
MNILTIDTSASLQIITIRKEQSNYSFSWEAGLTHTTTLMDKIDSALKECSLSPEEIDLFGAGMGPGSFTGIRIAASTIRMFAQVLRKPAAMAETHRLYAEGSGIYDGSLIVSFDAKKNRVFGALYSFSKGLLSEIISPGDYSMEYLINEYDGNSVLHFVGDGYLKYNDMVKKLAPDHIFHEKFIPEASAINSHIENIYLKDRTACMDFNKIIPFYRRKSDAEVLMEKNKE